MKRFVKIGVLGLLVWMFVGASGCYYVTRSKSYYGIKTNYQKMVFVVDASGSMEGKNEANIQDRAKAIVVNKTASAVGRKIGGPLGNLFRKEIRQEATKLGGAKRSLIPAIQGLPETAEFTILVFGRDVRAWQGGWVKATGAQKVSAIAFLKSLRAGGGTPAMKAMERAFSLPEVQAIFFLSDGRPTDSRAPQILAKVAQKNASKQVVVHTVGLGADQDRQFLRSLAEQNGGTFVSNP